MGKLMVLTFYLFHLRDYKTSKFQKKNQKSWTRHSSLNGQKRLLDHLWIFQYFKTLSLKNGDARVGSKTHLPPPLKKVCNTFGKKGTA